MTRILSRKKGVTCLFLVNFVSNTLWGFYATSHTTPFAHGCSSRACGSDNPPLQPLYRRKAKALHQPKPSPSFSLQATQISPRSKRPSATPPSARPSTTTQPPTPTASFNTTRPRSRMAAGLSSGERGERLQTRLVFPCILWWK